MDQYQLSLNLYDGTTARETVLQQYKKYQCLAAEIRALGGLLNCNRIYRKEILNEPLLLKLVKLIGVDKVDPILLTAVCQFTLVLFRCDEIRNDKKEMEPYYIAIKSCEKLLQYLGK